MDKNSREIKIDGLLNKLRRLFKKQISFYLNGADAVTISRNEDIERYKINPEKIWRLPLTG